MSFGGVNLLTPDGADTPLIGHTTHLRRRGNSPTSTLFSVLSFLNSGTENPISQPISKIILHELVCSYLEIAGELTFTQKKQKEGEPGGRQGGFSVVTSKGKMRHRLNWMLGRMWTSVYGLQGSQGSSLFFHFLWAPLAFSLTPFLFGTRGWK